MWNPSSLTVKVGDTVHWSWTGSPFVVRRGVAEITTRGDTEYNGVGFRSKQSVTGNFSHTFTTPGTYYYITEGYAHLGKEYDCLPNIYYIILPCLFRFQW